MVEALLREATLPRHHQSKDRPWSDPVLHLRAVQLLLLPKKRSPLTSTELLYEHPFPRQLLVTRTRLRHQRAPRVPQIKTNHKKPRPNHHCHYSTWVRPWDGKKQALPSSSLASWVFS